MVGCQLKSIVRWNWKFEGKQLMDVIVLAALFKKLALNGLLKVKAKSDVSLQLEPQDQPVPVGAGQRDQRADVRQPRARSLPR